MVRAWPRIFISPEPRSQFRRLRPTRSAPPYDSVILSGTFMSPGASVTLKASIDWGDGSRRPFSHFLLARMPSQPHTTTPMTPSLAIRSA